MSDKHRCCAILGASGHGKVVAEIAELNGYQIVFFDDRWPHVSFIEDWSVIGNTEALLEKAKDYALVVIGIGHNQTRLEKQVQLEQVGAKFDVLCHPQVVVSKYAKMAEGTVVMANAVINPFTSIGRACIVNTGATIDHDCTLADGVHISPGVNLAGSVEVGERTWIGIGSQVKQLVSLGCDVVVGAGSTVINNIPSFQVVAGTPAVELVPSNNH